LVESRAGDISSYLGRSVIDTAKTLKGEGRVYAGGFNKLEPKELATVTADFILNALPARRRFEAVQTARAIREVMGCGVHRS
jgi:hypothetical protein